MSYLDDDNQSPSWLTDTDWLSPPSYTTIDNLTMDNSAFETHVLKSPSFNGSWLDLSDFLDPDSAPAQQYNSTMMQATSGSYLNDLQAVPDINSGNDDFSLLQSPLLERTKLNTQKKDQALNKAWLNGMRDQKLLDYEERKSQEIEALESVRRVEVKYASEQTALVYQRNILALILLFAAVSLGYYLWYCHTMGPEFAYLRNRRIEKLALKLEEL